MRKVLILFISLSIHLSATYLIIDDTPIGVSDTRIFMNNIYKNFSNALEVGSYQTVLSIPLYIKSDSHENINLTLSNLSNLRNQTDNQEILSSFFYKSIHSQEIPIQIGVPFSLLDSGTQRDGNTVIGYLIIKTNTLSDTQTEGNYNLSGTLQAQIGVLSSNVANLSLSAYIPLTAIASLQSIVSNEKGQKFNSTNLHYGVFEFGHKAVITKNLFVKSNSLKNFIITFDSTPLIHTVYPQNKIRMNYFYTAINRPKIAINHTFIALVGKNSGQNTIGDLSFETEVIGGKHLAGEYRAVIGITITVQ